MAYLSYLAIGWEQLTELLNCFVTSLYAVRCRRKFLGWAFLCRVYRPGEWVWIDSNGKTGN